MRARESAVKQALPAVLWFFVSAWWFLADLYLQQAMGAWRIDLTLVLCVFAASVARASVLPWLVVCAGIARALVLGGAAAVHVVLLGVPIALLFPVRRLPIPPWLGRAALAGVTAVLLPALTSGTQALAAGALPAAAMPSPVSVLWSMATVPLAAAWLGRLPPLWFYREATA
jgi:hypothetical protein